MTYLPGPSWTDRNEDGAWCPACGDLVANSFHIDDDWEEPSECRQCGFPDDIDAMAEYFG